MTLEEAVRIQNKLGIHARPAALLVREAAKYGSIIEFEVDGLRVNGKSIMGVMMLAAAHGSNLIIIATGEDADAAVKGIRTLIESKFDEE
jgi:phosphocarrier protein HPr